MNDSMETKMIKRLRELYVQLGRKPNRYDWFMDNEMIWSEHFASWTHFLRAADLLDKYESAPRVSKELPKKEKLCEMLKLLEKRTGKNVDSSDWAKFVLQAGSSKVYSHYYGSSPSFRAGASLRTFWKQYLIGIPEFWWKQVRNSHLRDETVAIDDGWMNFRFDAGLDSYTIVELESLGLERLKFFFIGDVDISFSLVEEISFIRTWLIEDEMLKKSGRYRCSCESNTFKDHLAKCTNTKLAMLFSCLFPGLPHLAIYECFGTFLNYLETVYNQYVEERKKQNETDKSVEILEKASARSQDETNIDELLQSLKETVLKLRDAGLSVEIKITV